MADLKGQNLSPDSLNLSWTPDNRSHQEFYKLAYREMDLFNGDSSIFIVKETNFILEHLLPGRNYSISIIAVSQAVESNPTTIYQATSMYSNSCLCFATRRWCVLIGRVFHIFGSHAWSIPSLHVSD